MTNAFIFMTFPAGVLNPYKLALARFRQRFRPMICPSSFLRSPESGLIDSRQEPEAMIRDRFCGLGPESEFAPLGPQARQAHPALAQAFRIAYDRYKQELAVPTLSHLRSCDRLIVLIDLPGILNAGHPMANDVHDLTRDLVHEDDRDHLLLLLQNLVGRLTEYHPRAEIGFFCASAVQSTVSDSRSHALIGQPEFLPDGAPAGIPGPEKIVPVDTVPPQLPDRWEPGAFRFPEFKPRPFPGLKTRPPRHLGLDRIFNFIVGAGVQLIAGYCRLRQNQQIQIQEIRRLDGRATNARTTAKTREARTRLTGYLTRYDLKHPRVELRLIRIGMAGEELERIQSARRRLLEEEFEDTGRWIDEFRDSFQTVLDQAAERIIRKYMLRIGMATAAVPKGVLDSLVVTWGSLNMLGELCTIYNLRLGRLGTTVLLGRVFRNIFIAGILEDAADDAVQLLSNSINESIPGLGLLRRPAEGITNGILIRRLGFGARNLLRPCRP